MKTLMTFWINIPAPDISQGSAVISTLDQLTRPLVALGAVVGLVVGGVRLVWTARHEQPSQAILRGLLLMVVVTAAGATIVEVLLAHRAPAWPPQREVRPGPVRPQAAQPPAGRPAVRQRAVRRLLVVRWVRGCWSRRRRIRQRSPQRTAL